MGADDAPVPNAVEKTEQSFDRRPLRQGLSDSYTTSMPDGERNQGLDASGIRTRQDLTHRSTAEQVRHTSCLIAPERGKWSMDIVRTFAANSGVRMANDEQHGSDAHVLHRSSVHHAIATDVTHTG